MAIYIYKNIDLAPEGDYFLGISLTSTFFFSKKMIEKYYSKLQPKAKSLLVLVADSIEKYNYIYFKKISPDEALLKALQVGKQYEAGYKKLVVKFPSLSVILLSDLDPSPKLNRLKTIARDFFSKDELFRIAVEQQVKENIGGHLSSLRIDQVPSILLEYILDELAVTVGIYSGKILTRRIQVSPRLDTLLLRVYQGDFPKLSTALQIQPDELQYLVFKP